VGLKMGVIAARRRPAATDLPTACEEVADTNTASPSDAAEEGRRVEHGRMTLPEARRSRIPFPAKASYEPFSMTN